MYMYIVRMQVYVSECGCSGKGEHLGTHLQLRSATKNNLLSSDVDVSALVDTFQLHAAPETC